MIRVNIQKGFDLNITGAPTHRLEQLESPAHVGVMPAIIPFVKPRLRVKEGDRLKVGALVFEDKRNPQIRFLSPGAGEVVRIQFGPRRVIEELVIRLDADEQYEIFDQLRPDAIETAPREAVVEALLAGGVWPFIRALPFRDIADPGKVPPAIIVSLDTSEPFHPQSQVYLDGQTELFQLGLQILRRLSSTIHVTAAQRNQKTSGMLNGTITHVYNGAYPASDPGVLLYHIKSAPEENATWYIHGQDVLHLARMVKQGRYPTDRIVSVGGSSVGARQHFKTRAGVPLKHLVRDTVPAGPQRYILGGLFNGYHGHAEGFMGFYENALNVMPLPADPELLAFTRLGLNKLSHSRTFLSSFRKGALDGDCNTHGELRACVNCGYCTDICPVDILPQFTLKSLLVDEIEEALAHGLLDCVQCGLCSYVCPSKIELADTLTQFKASYYKER